jgi:hypothetical protein
MVALVIPPFALYVMKDAARMECLHGVMRAVDASGRFEKVDFGFKMNPNARSTVTLREGSLTQKEIKALHAILKAEEDVFDEWQPKDQVRTRAPNSTHMYSLASC